MAVSLEEYRLRIGVYGGGLRQLRGRKNKRHETYTPFTHSSDVHFRSITCFMLILPLLVLCKYAVIACNVVSLLSNAEYCQWSFASVNENIGVTHIFNYGQLKLLLSNDVESNPGPGDLETLLKAIKESESNLMAEMKTMQSDILEIKNEICTIKTEQATMKSEIDYVKEKQKALECNLSLTDSAAEKWQGVTENMQADVDHLINSIETHEEKLDSLKANVEELNKKAISNNMRVFGLAVEKSMSNDDLKSAVITKVLEVACPKERWIEDDIKTVRVFNNDQSPTPLVIVSFRYEDDKYQVYTGRDELRKHSIRVGDDITYEQRQTLKKLKSEGKTGYFYKGELRFRSENGDQTKSQHRLFRPAVRRLEQHDQPELGGTNSVEPDTMEHL